MLQCQNCGQVSAQRGNFCRFCGTKFLLEQVSNKPDFEQSPPRPYSWKTDEFQVADAPPRQKSRQINQVQPLTVPLPFAPPPPPSRPQSFVHQNQQPLLQQQQQYQHQLQQQRPNLAYSPHCPRCASQYIRFEKKISTAGWIVFAVLMVTFFPLFWIGLLIKEDATFCQVCNYKIT